MDCFMSVQICNVSKCFWTSLANKWIILPMYVFMPVQGTFTRKSLTTIFAFEFLLTNSFILLLVNLFMPDQVGLPCKYLLTLFAMIFSIVFWHFKLIIERLLANFNRYFGFICMLFNGFLGSSYSADPCGLQRTLRTPGGPLFFLVICGPLN